MILITGAGGQIGTVLAKALRKKHGTDQVLTTDIRPDKLTGQFFELLDVTDGVRLLDLVNQYEITQIYHLASILSAKGEKHPLPTWEINMGSLLNVLEVASKSRVEKVFYPSSIAIYGEETNLKLAPQFGAQLPTTVYGISKVAGELWCDYYFKHHGVDVRSVRLPGIIGSGAMPGGGTTDYAVEIYHAAVRGKLFECYISEDEKMPMIYMDDAMRAIIELMEAPNEDIQIRHSYNIASMSFSPKEIYSSIKKFLPDFELIYKPDFRDGIAKSWPDEIDDTQARKDWNWLPKYDLDAMTKVMLDSLSKQYGFNTLR